MFERVLLVQNADDDWHDASSVVQALVPCGMEEAIALYVVNPGRQIGFDSDVFERMVACKRNAESQFAALGRGLTGPCRCRIELGELPFETRRVAVEEGATLVVVRAVGGLIGAKRVHDIMDLVPLPVLVVGEPGSTRDTSGGFFERVLVAVDFSKASLEALGLVRRICRSSAKTVIVAQVKRHSNEITMPEVSERFLRLKAEFEFIGVPIRTTIAAGPEFAAIQSIGNRENVSCVIVGYKGRQFLSDLMHGSISTALMRNPFRPALMVPGSSC